MYLSELKTNQKARIVKVHHTADSGQDGIAIRLDSLGFVQGEAIEVITKGLFGGEPILVKVGFSRFALRRAEADRIEIEL